MNHQNLRTAMTETIGTDRSTLPEIRAHMSRISQQRHQARRRGLAMAGSATTVAAVVGAVFVVGGARSAGPETISPQAPSTRSAPPSEPSPIGVLARVTHLQFTADESARASAQSAQISEAAAEESARASAASDQESVVSAAAQAQASAQYCSTYGREHPVAPNGVVDDTAVRALARACANGFGSISEPRIAWVETDAAGVQKFLDSASPRVASEPFLLIVVDAKFAPGIGDGENEVRGVITVPLTNSTEVGVGFPGTTASDDVLEQLGTVHRN